MGRGERGRIRGVVVRGVKVRGGSIRREWYERGRGEG